MQPGSSVTDHWLKSYMDAAIAIVQAQFTAKRFESGTQVGDEAHSLALFAGLPMAFTVSSRLTSLRWQTSGYTALHSALPHG